MENICRNCRVLIAGDSFECPYCGSGTGIFDDDGIPDWLLGDTKGDEEPIHGEFGIGRHAIAFKQGVFDDSPIHGNWFDEANCLGVGKYLPYIAATPGTDASEDVQPYLSYSGDADRDWGDKTSYDFETEILSVKKQSGEKYKPISSDGVVWSRPVLEVTTRHGIYITHPDATWVLNRFNKRMVRVWSERSSRDGCLWLHQSTWDQVYDGVVCEGCCNKEPSLF